MENKSKSIAQYWSLTPTEIEAVNKERQEKKLKRQFEDEISRMEDAMLSTEEQLDALILKALNPSNNIDAKMFISLRTQLEIDTVKLAGARKYYEEFFGTQPVNV